MTTPTPADFPLSRALELLVNKRRWRFVTEGCVLTTEELCASDGMLPALMNGAHHKGMVDPSVFAQVKFCMEGEPSSLNCLCGAFVASTPEQSVWLFALFRYLEDLRKATDEDVVPLDGCWEQWKQRLVQGDLDLDITEPC